MLGLRRESGRSDTAHAAVRLTQQARAASRQRTPNEHGLENRWPAILPRSPVRNERKAKSKSKRDKKEEERTKRKDERKTQASEERQTRRKNEVKNERKKEKRLHERERVEE